MRNGALNRQKLPTAPQAAMFGCTKRGQSAAFAMRVRVAGAPFAVGRVMRGEAERALLNITGEPRGPDSSSVVSGIPVGAVACCCCAACFTCWGFLLSHPSALTYSALGTQQQSSPNRAWARPQVSPKYNCTRLQTRRKLANLPRTVSFHLTKPL